MKSPQYFHSSSMIGGLALALVLSTAAPSAQANVYATNIKINGGITNVSVAQGTNVSISYILNEPASAGVTIKVLSGATAVRTISIAGGGAGTTRGTNTVVWDGKNDSSTPVPGGNYTVSVKAVSSGYAGWTKLTDDDNPGNYVWESRGIAVDRNTNSPYYGRVFVGNSLSGPGSLNGDLIGIQKLNADGSVADEGGFSTGGIAWSGQGGAPWKIRVSDDDYVYVQDQVAYGDIYRFDPVLSTNSMLHVFAPDTFGSQGNWTGFCLVGQGTNTVLWGADAENLASLGIEKFSVQPDGTFEVTNGIQVVGIGGAPGLRWAPFALSVDQAGNLYTVQYREPQGDADAFVLRFPAYNPSTNGGEPEYTADWAMGPGDDYGGGHGIAVDPTGTYVAATFWGYYDGTWHSGNTKIFNSVNGTLVTNLDLNVSYPSGLTSEPTHHMDTDADWDAAGNLYYLDDWPGCWRAFSPPGANQATTVALPVVQVIASAPPPVVITSVGDSAGMITIHFTGGSSDLPWGFVLLGASVAQGPYAPVAGAVYTGSGGTFQVTVPANGLRQFYRVDRLVTIPLHITSLKVASGTATINFTGSANDSPTALTVFSSATINGTYSAAAGAIISQVSSGLFQATVPVTATRQFYDIRK